MDRVALQSEVRDTENKQALQEGNQQGCWEVPFQRIIGVIHEWSDYPTVMEFIDHEI